MEHEPVAPVALKVESLSISFDGLQALDSVSFEVPRNSIVGLIGPNGAGKSTLINCLTRVYVPDSGGIRFEGASLLELQAHQLIRAGIARTFQNLELAGERTALENVLAGAMSARDVPFLADLFGLAQARAQHRVAEDEARESMCRLGVDRAADQLVNTLPYGVQKKIELARAIAARPRLLLLDEPAAGLNPDETDALADLLRQLHGAGDLTILLIEHDMKFVMRLCESLVVLDHGVVIARGTPEQIRADAKVVEAYLGEELDPAA